jgi:hypothetical protein
MSAGSRQEFWARLFPNSIRAAEFDSMYGTNYSGRRNADRNMSSRDVQEARFGRGRYAGKTGDPFIDDPFFNPFAPGSAYLERRNGDRHLSLRDIEEARWGNGLYAGRTGDPFIDDPFFNPWAPGGVFNR